MIKSLTLKEKNGTGFVCDLAALSPEQRERRAAVAEEILALSREMRELDSGYAFRFDFSPSLVGKLAQLASLEHLCCPFLGIGVTLKTRSRESQLWLELTGDIGVKAFLQAELGIRSGKSLL